MNAFHFECFPLRVSLIKYIVTASIEHIKDLFIINFGVVLFWVDAFVRLSNFD